MSDVNLVFTVSSVTSAITVDTTTVNVTPNTTAISMFAGYAAYPPDGAAGNSRVIFNDAGLFGGEPEFTYTKSTETVNITNLNVIGTSELGGAGDVRISGGSAGQFLTATGSGNLEFTTLTPGGNTTELQFNDAGSFAGNPRLTFDPNSYTLSLSGNLIVSTGGTESSNVIFDGSNVYLGDTPNVHIYGGNVGDILTTDSYGGLSWIPQAGGTGSGVAGGPTYSIQFNSGSGNFGGTQSLTYVPSSGTINIQQVAEKVTLSSSGSGGVMNYDLKIQSIITKSTDATSNFTLNFRGSSSISLNNLMEVGRSMTCVYINKNGATPYFANAFQVDGVSVTPKWFDGTPPGGGSANAYDIYTFNILKTADATFLVFANAARYV